MPFYNPNAYYNPFANQGIFGGPPGVSGLYNGHGIFGLYASETDFLKDLQGRLNTPAPTPPHLTRVLPPGAKVPVLPDPAANVGQSLEAIESRMAAGGPTFNTATQLNNAAAGKTGGETGGGAGGAGGAGQATQNYGILPWLGVGLYGLNTLGNLYLGHEALNQGWAQFRFQRELANQNLANSIQAYNNALRSRIRGRSGAFSEEDVDRMMEDQKLRDTRKRR